MVMVMARYKRVDREDAQVHGQPRPDDDVYLEALSGIGQHIRQWLERYNARSLVAVDARHYLTDAQWESLRAHALIVLTPEEEWLIESILQSIVTVVAGGPARLQCVVSPCSMGVDRVVFEALDAMCRQAAGLPWPRHAYAYPDASRFLVVRMPSHPSPEALARVVLQRLQYAGSVPRDPDALAERMSRVLAHRRIVALAVTHIGAEHLPGPGLPSVLRWVEQACDRGVNILLSAWSSVLAHGPMPGLLPLFSPNRCVVAQFDPRMAAELAQPYWDVATRSREQAPPRHFVDAMARLHGQRQWVAQLADVHVASRSAGQTDPLKSMTAEAVRCLRERYAVPVAMWEARAAGRTVAPTPATVAWHDYLPPPPWSPVDVMAVRHGLA